MLTPGGVQVEEAGKDVPVVQETDGLRIPPVMVPGGAVVGLGLKAVEIPVGGRPGVGIAALIERTVLPRIDVHMPQDRDRRGALHKLRWEMGGVVHRVHREAPVFIVQVRNAGVVEDRHRLPVIERHAQQLCQHTADGDPVGRDDHGAPRVCLRDLIQGLQHALLHLPEGLGSGETEACRVVHEGIHQLRLLILDVCKGPALPRPDVDLPEAPVAADGQIMIAGDGRGGKARPEEVAGIDRVHRDIPEAQAQGVPLLLADGRDVPVPVPLHEAVEVPLRLDMSNYINFCHQLHS